MLGNLPISCYNSHIAKKMASKIILTFKFYLFTFCFISCFLDHNANVVIMKIRNLIIQNNMTLHLYFNMCYKSSNLGPYSTKNNREI